MIDFCYSKPLFNKQDKTNENLYKEYGMQPLQNNSKIGTG